MCDCGRLKRAEFKQCEECGQQLKAEMRKAGYLQVLPKPHLWDERNENEGFEIYEPIVPFMTLSDNS